jgi:hypothetical protein
VHRAVRTHKAATAPVGPQAARRSKGESSTRAETAYFPERYGEIAVPYLIRLVRHEEVPQFLYVQDVVLTWRNRGDYSRPTGC